MDLNPMDFGGRFKQALLDNDAPIAQERASEWLQKRGRELGVPIKVSGTMIFRYFNNEALPRVEQGRKYAYVLGVTVEWLYTGAGPRTPLTATETRLVELFRQITSSTDRGRALGLIEGIVGTTGPTLVLASSRPTATRNRQPPTKTARYK